jgi:hypothetical protein
MPSGPFSRALPRRLPATLPRCLTATLPLLVTLGCAPAEGGPAWRGQIDTLPSGTVVVTNPATGIWDSSTAWRVVEELRIGTMDGTGPELFGQINAVEMDRAGRIYVLEGQAQEIRVFDRDGTFIRTIGRKGGGPGEFNQPIGMAWSPAGELWVIDPQNNRISVIDTAGTFVTSHPAIGGWVYMPWPGGFDTAGAFYTYAPDLTRRPGGMYMVRHDTALNPVDSLQPPTFPGDQEFFEVRSERGSMRTGVPFSPSIQWTLTTAGDFWAALTGPYELFRVSGKGDTLRRVTRAFDAVPVTSEDVDSAVTGLEWFTKQGGKVDRSRIPGVKPALRGLFVADDGHLWVAPTTPDRADNGYVFDIFDPDGRYLGRVRLPFNLSRYPPPMIRSGIVLGVTEDELEVPFVVRARIVEP